MVNAIHLLHLIFIGFSCCENNTNERIFQHFLFFEAQGISTNICNLELICLFIYQLSIRDESSHQSISKKW